ncbi:hypothetical protein ACHRV1_20740 [Flavobacterium aquidurense]|uniref:hypothetical protein n=1 Tax=Flavobacterium aquidurense TaxID=362413 RepID=UPI00375641A4
MITGNNENYGRDDRNFYHPEDDIRLGSEKKENDLYAVSRNNDESYVDEYQKRTDEDFFDEDPILNQDEDPDDLDEDFSNALDRDDDDEDYFEEEDLDESDLDDDLVEDYDENDREINSFAKDRLKEDELDQEYDIDQDLEEKDPVNNPREF